MKTRYAILVVALALSSCMFQEELSPADDDFRGSWDSDRYAIQIFRNGYGVVDIRNRGRCEGNVRIEGDRIIFRSETESSTIGRKAFRIDQRPMEDGNGVWFMVLDGERLERL